VGGDINCGLGKESRFLPKRKKWGSEPQKNSKKSGILVSFFLVPAFPMQITQFKHHTNKTMPKDY
jgi:hypothetical protein